MPIITPDLYWAPSLDIMDFADPLKAGVSIQSDDPMAEIVAMSFHSIGWFSKYILGTELCDYQICFQKLMWSKKYPLLIASRGAAKTFSLALYSISRGLLLQGSKIIIVSASFRQAKRVFEEIEAIYRRAPLLRAAAGSAPKRSVDHCLFRIGDSVIKALPLGDGSKIRGERASTVLVDEVDSVDQEVFNVVVRGFGATQLDPISKLKESYRNINSSKQPNVGNQIIISGTAGFQDGNFHQMYRQYLKIINCQAQDYGYNLADELGENYGDTFIDYRNYGLMILPWQKIPEGILDRDLISNAKITMSSMLFNMEYNCIFADVSRGFFSHKAIDGATAKGMDGFTVQVKGKEDREYVMGVDPARTGDAFAIVVLEIGKPHKVVYIKTLLDTKFSESVKVIRRILAKFNVIRIAMDAGGGGLTVEEMLENPEYFVNDQKPIFDIETEKKTRDGEYILNVVNFTSKWIEEANFLLQKNIEDCSIMFPSRVVKSEAYKDDKTSELIDDTYEEVNECKREMYQISVTQTKNGNRHFDIDPTLEAKKKKVKPRKDRYSALLLANYFANEIIEEKAGRKTSKDRILQQWDDFNGGWVDQIE